MIPCTSSRSSCAGVVTATSDALQPTAQLGAVELAGGAVADARVVEIVLYRDVRVRRVPDLRRQLMQPRPLLEPLLMEGAFSEEPARRWKSHAVAPDGRQPVARLVDEVAQVALPAAVIVAEKEQSPAVIDDRPAPKMDGRDASQISFVVHV